MKAKPFQVSALTNQIDTQFVGALVFGTDVARIQDISHQIKKIILKQEDPFALFTLTPAQLKNTPFLITDEANTPSLMQTRRLIWVKEGQSLSVDTLVHFCQNRQTDAFLLISADNLPKNNALRCEAESLPDFLTIACYPPEGPELYKIVSDFAQKNAFSIQPAAIDYLIQNINNDMLMLKNELEKLALYNQDKKPIDLETIKKLIGVGNVQIDSFIQAIAHKKTSYALSLIFPLLNQGEQPVTLTRYIGRYLDLLLQGKNLQKQGKSALAVAETLLKPAQFRLKQPFQEQLHLWTIPQLVKAKHLLLSSEIQLKSATLQPELILKKLIFNLTASGSLK